MSRNGEFTGPEASELDRHITGNWEGYYPGMGAPPGADVPEEPVPRWTALYVMDGEEYVQYFTVFDEATSFCRASVRHGAQRVRLRAFRWEEGRG